MKHLLILSLTLICMLSLGLLGCTWNSEDIRANRSTTISAINDTISDTISDSTKSLEDTTKFNDIDTTKYPIGFDININDRK